ncbi:transporter, partial [Ruminococcaceae bacterium OttesenSCG-928-O06]|nr:transporter [Ruminococcaceae bacterium OttesenSCG-928-O06]
RTAELTPKQKENMRKVSLLVGSLTFVVLGIGLIWTVYYLILGAVDPAYSDYATNMSQLIVSVLTVFSIIIAFYQFLREKP